MENEFTQFPTGELMYKRDAALFLGISMKTLESYVNRGILTRWKNQVNGRTYYDKKDLLKVLGSRLPQTREVWVYARAAGIPDQGAAGVLAQKRLKSQVDRVLSYCTAAGIRVDRVVQEIGKAGVWHGRVGLNEIMEGVLKKKISTIIVDTPDRLARFAGRDMFESFLHWHGVELHYIQKTLYLEEYREELKDDLAHLIFEAKAIIGEG